MPENKDTQLNEANPENGATKPEVQGVTITPENGGKTFSQSDLDNVAAKARGTAERETKKKLLAQLGLTIDDEDKLLKFKEAYQNSLSEEDKRNAELTSLQAEKVQLAQDLEEKDYIIKALVQLTGKNEAEVDKIVKMAKGLKTDTNTIDDAISEVIKMITPVSSNNEQMSTNPGINQPINPNMPYSQPLNQPSSNIVVDNTSNPFKAGQINLTAQGKLLSTNPELAKKLAAEAGVKLTF